ncbi:MAG: bifunctional riboflavin kinase/FAD synthetase [Actinomycetota bacterium]|nr:bifunctional riboflavin kinase/FAD synthetase [Actinomycetota bacterium]
MDVLRGIDQLEAEGRPAAVTIGFFDGVHRGHQAVIRRTVDVAAQRGLDAVAVTFDRHPLETLSPGKAPLLLTTLERKIELVSALGVDRLLVLEFTEDLSRWQPDEFAKRVLADGLRAEHVVVGTNFTFGHRAMGNLLVLAELGEGMGFTVEGMALLRLNGRGVSSTSIREALVAGDLEWPERALGRRYSVEGRVVRGAGRGTGLGWPTANLETPPSILLPDEGAYAGIARGPRGEFVAAINIGGNPTFGAEPVHIEAYLLDFQGDLVGETLEIEFWTRLHDEIAFESAEALADQIAEDVERTRQLVGRGPPATR